MDVYCISMEGLAEQRGYIVHYTGLIDLAWLYMALRRKVVKSSRSGMLSKSGKVGKVAFGCP
jgi:hypothetical protein